MGEPPADGSLRPRSPSGRALAWTRRRRAMARSWAAFRRNRQGVLGLVILGLIALLALFAPALVNEAQLEPAAASAPTLHPPSLAYPLGTDNFGRSVLDLIIMGSRISLIVGLAATAGAVLLGAAVGVTAGFFGGRWIDGALSAVTNWVLVLPWVAFAVALATVLGRGLGTIILVIAITSWPSTARMVRAQTLSIRERSYVERARALGASDWHIMTRHVLPNVMPVLLANGILTVALSILSETTLSILGLGDPTAVSWGGIIEAAFSAGALTAGWWWWIVPPGVAIVLVTLSFTLCGYALDEVLNPQLRER
jgi:peptide/nickel transport system permease protein